MKKIAVLMAVALVLSTVFFSTSVFAVNSYPIQEKLLVVLVEFTETEASLESLETYTNNYVDGPDGSRIRIYDGNINKDDVYYSNMFFGTGIDPETGKMKNTVRNYFSDASNGRVDSVPIAETSNTVNDGIVRIKLSEPFPDPRTAYIASGYGAGSLKDEVFESISQNVFEKLDELNCVDFSSLDAVTPDKLHIVFVLASGHSDTYPYTRAFNNGLATFEVNGQSYSNARVSIVNSNQTNEIGTICHELAHDKDTRDLYNKQNSNIGHLSLMNSVLSQPTHLDPWNEIIAGFVEPTVINQSGIYQVNSVDPNTPGEYNILKIPVPSLKYNKSEYFLIENRQFTGFDSVIAPFYSSGGIAIWHIDDTYTEGQSLAPITISLELAGDYENDSLDWLYRNNGTGNKCILSPNSSPGTSNTSEGKTTGIMVVVNSPSSDSMTVTIQILNAPTNFKAVADGRNTKLSWDPVPGASEYEISIDNGTFSSVGSNTSYIVPGFGKHCYQVRAKNT
ncbi:MAG TPA: hypothetical protein VHT34_06655, partial [Clostridia bacterium]|nr:hypothetical protein [Clostridia bacterium]